MIRKIGILTSGGDSPGMNAAVVSVARCAAMNGIQLMGIKRGYNGLLGLSKNPEDDICALDLETVLDIADQRGTFLRTARCVEFKQPEVRRQAAENLRQLGIDALVVIGGDGSFTGAMYLCELGIPCVGIPGTIDNDLGYTEATLGYDTAVNVCVEAVRSIRATSRRSWSCRPRQRPATAYDKKARSGTGPGSEWRCPPPGSTHRFLLPAAQGRECPEQIRRGRCLRY